MRTLTPIESQVGPQRRKTSRSSERLPKKGAEGYIKRPENAFILFRRKCCEDRAAALSAGADSADIDDKKKERQADLSKTISAQWRSLSAPQRAYWEDLARQKKKEHEEMYPDYQYRPQRKESTKGKVSKRASKVLAVDESRGESLLVPPGFSNRTGARSTSAPTPPPAFIRNGTLELPSLWSGRQTPLGPSPSCPASPSLLPMISKRSLSRQGALVDPRLIANGFDYVPPTYEGNVDMNEGAEYIKVCIPIPPCFRHACLTIQPPVFRIPEGDVRGVRVFPSF